MLAAHGISCEGKTARQITRQDYAAYDIIIGMDTHNIRNMNRIFGGDPKGKVRMLLDRDVADPWYTGNFDATWRDCLRKGWPQGCCGSASRGRRPAPGKGFWQP